ncbi:restriction endonuclease subunit S [Pseudomonas sp. UBA7530]|uniref:restriction endonuclease subunit S n=1 Tax=Pseudomonas sp. UBA7530 TaxID=1947341 RepID=UPI0025D7B59E|nr:restriction endonuclease subunit S [Pseudomonas sp. UBA7530]
MNELKSPTLGSAISIAKGKKHEVSESPSKAAKRLIGIDDLRNDDLIRYTDDSNGVEAMPDDVLIAWDGANAGTIGFGKSGYIGSTIARLRLKTGVRLFTPFLGLYLKSKFGFLRKTATGATIPHINRSALESIPLPAVDFDDQIRIAHLLGKVEGLIARRKQHLRQLDDLLKSVFLDMFGPTCPGHDAWPQVEIRELAANHKGAMRTGPFGSNLLHSEFTSDGDVAVLGIDNAVQNRFAWGERRFISDEKYQELQGYRIFPGDVIVTIMGTIGRSAVIPDDIPVAINTKHLAAITLNREVANPLFLSYSIHSSPFVLRQFASKNRGAIMSGLNLGIIKETKIKRPPIELQNRFADIHEQVDQLKSSYQQSLYSLEALYGALSQKAFKGELDLSRVVLPALSIEGESLMAVALPTPTTAPAIKLPETKLLLPALENHEQLQPLLHFWLETYCAQLGSTAFSVERFIVAAQNRLSELHPENDFELGADAYEHIKSWVFEALTAGHLKQWRNITDHEKESGKPIFGNMVELKAAQA